MEKAYKQIPGDARRLALMIIVLWNPVLLEPAYFIPLCQLFGGKSPPLNFARYAAWLCEVAGSLFALPLTHCVDDIICVEPEELVESGHIAFKLLCVATGWAISPNKAPPPSSVFVVIGVELNLSGTPDSEAILKISAKRVSQLLKILEDIRHTARLGP